MEAAGKKRGRCQVPGCKVEIPDDKKPRFCWKCAKADQVLIEGKSSRYCQLCKKFHIVSEFDNGKRSCRTKAEEHNKQRRDKRMMCKEYNKQMREKRMISRNHARWLSQGPASEELSCDLETVIANATRIATIVPDKDLASSEDEPALVSQDIRGENLVASEDEPVANFGSALVRQDIRSDSHDANMNGTKDSSKKNGPSSSNCGANKSASSSMCSEDCSVVVEEMLKEINHLSSIVVGSQQRKEELVRFVLDASAAKDRSTVIEEMLKEVTHLSTIVVASEQRREELLRFVLRLQR